MTGDHPVHPLIVILGPTAVGKTTLAIDLALALNGEIIGADSRQIYRYMDIGTAKPTTEQLDSVPHHLIDLVAPDENLTLANYQRHAYSIINDVHQRGRIPLLVGGTGQYITAVTEGWSIPEVPPNETLRAELEDHAREHGPLSLHQRLEQTDPTAAAGIHPNNVRRVIRALEVCIETGKPISQLQQKHPPPYRILELGLTLDRHILYERADKRIDSMMQQGFLEEVRWLLDAGYDRNLPSMSGLGYAQLAAHLTDHYPLKSAIQDTITATHDFIRRQFTWFRGHDNGIMWHNTQQIDTQTLIALCTNWLNTR